MCLAVLLELSVYLRPSEGKRLLSVISVLTAVVFEQTLPCCSLGPCYSAVIAVLSIAFQNEEADGRLLESKSQ